MPNAISNSSVKHHIEQASLYASLITISIRLTILETYEGEVYREFESPELGQDTSYAVQRRGHLTFVLDSTLTIPGYADRTPGIIEYDSRPAIYPLSWLYPPSAPEIVEQDTLIWCGFGGCRRGGATLRRGVGLTEWYFRDSNRFGGFSYSLTLEE